MKKKKLKTFERMEDALLPSVDVDGEVAALDGSAVYGKPAAGTRRRCEWIYDLVPQNETEHRVHVAAMFVRDALSVRSIDHRTDRWSVAIYSMCVAREAAQLRSNDFGRACCPPYAALALHCPARAPLSKVECCSLPGFCMHDLSPVTHRAPLPPRWYH